MFFFFFKQKTAYEMRISDWSSDVCSSDLPTVCRRSGLRPRRPSLGVVRAGKAVGGVPPTYGAPTRVAPIVATGPSNCDNTRLPRVGRPCPTASVQDRRGAIRAASHPGGGRISTRKKTCVKNERGACRERGVQDV